jgi:hypothetical protein
MAARSDFVTWIRGKLLWAAGLSVDSDIQVIFSLVEVPYEWCKKGHRDGGFYTGTELTLCKICRRRLEWSEFLLAAQRACCSNPWPWSVSDRAASNEDRPKHHYPGIVLL